MPDVLAWIGILGGLVTIVAAAYISLRKGKADVNAAEAVTAKQVRNGIVEEWRGVVDLLRAENEKCHAMSTTRIDALYAEVATLRNQISELYTENSKLRSLIVAKDTRTESQATQVEKLQTEVVLLKESAPVVHIPGGTTVTVPESTMKPKEEKLGDTGMKQPDPPTKEG